MLPGFLPRNTEQLQYFYYVALHRGVERAAPHLPMRMTAKTLENHMNVLQQDIQSRLFHADPFCLTPKGEQFYQTVRGLVEGLPRITSHIRGESLRAVGVVCSPWILREHLLDLLQQCFSLFPGRSFNVRAGEPEDPLQQLERSETRLLLHLAAVGKQQPAPKGRVRLGEARMVLLLPEKSPCHTLEDFLNQRSKSSASVGLPGQELIAHRFSEGLSGHPKAEAALLVLTLTADTIERDVRSGRGAGVAVLVPGQPPPAGLRAVPLPGFPTLELVALWRGNKENIIKELPLALREALSQSAAVGHRPGHR